MVRARTVAGLSHDRTRVRVNRPVRFLYAVLAMAVAAGFAALGLWQSGRALQKQHWLEGYAAALVAQPRSLDSALSVPLGDLPERVSGIISLRSGPVLLLDNQQREGHVGVRAYVLADGAAGNTSVLVELGWLPLAADRRVPTVPVPSGRLSVDGLLLPWPGQGLRLAENPWDETSETQLLTYLDRGEIARHVGASPYDGVLRPDPALDLGPVRDSVALPNTVSPATHRGYAVQWWGLSATVVIVYLVLALRRRTK